MLLFLVIYCAPDTFSSINFVCSRNGSLLRGLLAITEARNVYIFGEIVKISLRVKHVVSFAMRNKINDA